MTTVSVDAIDVVDDHDQADPTLPMAPSVRAVVIPAWLRVSSPVWIWAGMLLIAVGFGLIGLTWAQTSTEGLVDRQIPYLVSGGFTALGLIMIGVLLVSVSTRQMDAIRRQRQSDNLIAILEELQTAMANSVRSS